MVINIMLSKKYQPPDKLSAALDLPDTPPQIFSVQTYGSKLTSCQISSDLHDTLSNCSTMAKMNTHQKLNPYFISFTRYSFLKYAQTSPFGSSAPADTARCGIYYTFQ